MIKLIDEQFLKNFQVFDPICMGISDFQISQRISRFWAHSGKSNYKYFDPFCIGEEIFKFSNFSMNCKILSIFQKSVKNICPSLTDKYFLQVKNICPFVCQT